MYRNDQRLLVSGMVLFLLGLLSGLAVTAMPNARMGLSAHLEGVMNGMFLIAAGLCWNRIKLNRLQEKTAFWLLLYGSFANFVLIQSASILGTSKMTPIAGKGYGGSDVSETLMSLGLVSVALAMIAAVGLMAAGLLKYEKSS